MLTGMPIYHIAGMLWGFTAPIYAGCKMVIVQAAYGLSETHTGDTFSPLDKPRIGSVGIPHTGTDIKIMDFDDPTHEL